MSHEEGKMSYEGSEMCRTCSVSVPYMTLVVMSHELTAKN
jgi:hypothetical protein